MVPEPEPESRRGGWRLARETSAYLRSAAEQAIDWHPWGAEAFDIAQRTGRPILLDVGASWCHWCHVMDEGTYSDPEVARLLGQHFVAVKVDRDQNPEIDRRYQRQVNVLTGEGGWPLTAFLTPAGEVFLGGTYFPATDGHGRPGFRRVLKEVARVWKEEPERVRENASAVKGALGRLAAARAGSRAPKANGLSAFASGVVQEIRSSVDPVNAGFGGAPKFPHPTAIALLLWDAFSRGEAASADRARETLLRMADGGMYDQVGGGFHRYSVDEAWHIPHFEKMAVDNAALLSVYVEGAQRFGEPRFDEVIRGTIGWVREVLADPAGGFGASQDADNAPGDDGSYFTWTRAELREALPPAEHRLLSRFFGVDTDGRMPHDPDRNVLFRLLPLAEAAEGLELPGGPESALSTGIETLRRVRGKRPTPTVDRAIYADLNGRLIAGLARAGAYLGDESVLADARRAADRLLRDAYRPRTGIAHRLDPAGPVGFGLLEDQVAFATGLLELGGALAEPAYLTPAVSLLELIDREFRGEDGLLRDVAPHLYDGPGVGGVGEPSYPLEDSPHLSANAGAALAFLRLSALVHDDRWTEKARALVTAMSSRIGNGGLFAAGAALAAGWLETSPASVVIEGSGPAAEALARAARRAWHPNVWVFEGFPPAPFSGAGETGTEDREGAPRALVCFGTACAPPVAAPEAIAPLLATGGRPTTT